MDYRFSAVSYDIGLICPYITMSSNILDIKNNVEHVRVLMLVEHQTS